MSRSSARRAQIEPLAAIAAVFAVTAGLSIYAGMLDDVLPRSAATANPEGAIPAVEAALEANGVVDPSRLTGRLLRDGAAGETRNVSLVVDDRRWAVGPAAPVTARAATERVSVRLGAGDVKPGRLTVRVWR
jgi:hypothetical protein